jgi:hypothetical protein
MGSQQFPRLFADPPAPPVSLSGEEKLRVRRSRQQARLKRPRRPRNYQPPSGPRYRTDPLPAAGTRAPAPTQRPECGFGLVEVAGDPYVQHWWASEWADAHHFRPRAQKLRSFTRPYLTSPAKEHVAVQVEHVPWFNHHQSVKVRVKWCPETILHWRIRSPEEHPTNTLHCRLCDAPAGCIAVGVPLA